MWQQTPVFITSFNNLDRGLKRLIAWLQEAGMERIYVIDNASSWAPLLEYYETLKGVTLLRQTSNLGQDAFWKLGYHHHQTGRFIVTDPDVVPDAKCPLDLVYKMHQVAEHENAQLLARDNSNYEDSFVESTSPSARQQVVRI